MDDSPLSNSGSRVIVRLSKLSGHSSNIKVDLNPHDRERAARFRFDEDRRRLFVGRWLLGNCLTTFFGLPFAAGDLVYSDAGRPILATHSEIQFSITHAGDVVGVALSLNSQVGLDVERIDRAIDHGALAKRIMSTDDLQRFNGLPSADRIRGFFQAWTTKEAWLKARGIGISGGVREASAPLLPNLSSRILDSGQMDGRTWSVQALPVPDGYCGNVVWDDPTKTVDFNWLAPDET